MVHGVLEWAQTDG